MMGFVANVMIGLSGDYIDLLHIQVHGDSEAMDFGSDTLDLEGLKGIWRPHLSNLGSFFYYLADPWVHLRTCDIGQNIMLLQNLAALWGVTVCAGRGKQINAGFDVNFGRYAIVTPDGTTTIQTFEPEEAKYRSSLLILHGWSVWKAGSG